MTAHISENVTSLAFAIPTRLVPDLVKRAVKEGATEDLVVTRALEAYLATPIRG